VGFCCSWSNEAEISPAAEDEVECLDEERLSSAGLPCEHGHGIAEGQGHVLHHAELANLERLEHGLSIERCRREDGPQAVDESDVGTNHHIEWTRMDPHHQGVSLRELPTSSAIDDDRCSPHVIDVEANRSLWRQHDRSIDRQMRGDGSHDERSHFRSEHGTSR